MQANLANPLVSPIFADLAGLPPLLIQVTHHGARAQATERGAMVDVTAIGRRGRTPGPPQVGGAETLRDEGTVFAERARSAGVDVTLEVYPEMVHVFQMLPKVLVGDRGAHAQTFIATFVAKHIPGPPVPTPIVAGPQARL